ncbi:G2/M phase-specific E3 ubiquitin-protein ligase [Scleropages formosus]|uniref:G2/M phase-specific E3 ubiquitin-protein ligase n=1 Tax=Scleropages formosus TaxID=113540 RepID=UPI00087851CB|nr:G2/M phase-specific E3 ubiquitin-protein ligase [Scleropages formosus]
MKRTRCEGEEELETNTNSKEICELCKLSDDCPSKYGEKITLKHHNLTVHYFCLLMSSGVYQRGDEDEGIYGFLVEDIKREIRRSSRLACTVCKKKGASVGCNIKSCRKVVHLPCGIQEQFIFQFTGQFPSFCREHCPTQTNSQPSCPSTPLSCSICLEFVEPVLSYTVLKCPCCHSSWFHRDCVQHQAYSAALFFFRCTICNNKDKFQQEMLRMGIHIPERDASWELEENAYGELLQVYQRCDALKCISHKGRKYSTQEGKWEILRCNFCGSNGTHRKCASLKLFETKWVCDVCRPAANGNENLCRNIKSPPSGTKEMRRLLKRRKSSLHSVVCKRSSLQRNTPGEILHTLASQISKHQFMSVVVRKDGVFKAALELLRQADFDPHHSLKVTFPDDEEQTNDMNNGNLQRFPRLLIQDLQNSVLFEGPENKKNLALNSQAVQEDFYFDAGCIIALSLIHGGPPLGFFSEALYKCLFNFPRDSHLTVEDMGESLCAAKVRKIRDAQSVKDLKKAVSSASDYLEVAGCLRQINSLSDKQPLVKDIVNFHLVTRMQLPLKRFRDGLNTLGLFEHIQMFPEIFSDLFCYPPAKISAHTMANLFFVQFSDNEEKKKKEIITEGFWRQYLHDCEEGRCATSLEDILIFATSKDIVPAMGFNPNPSVSFVHSLSSVGTVPERQPCYNKIVLPVATTYEIFKKHLEYAVCQYTLMQTI